MKLKCPECGYEWEYDGGKSVYCTCPDCHRSIKIEENKVGGE